MGVHNCCIINCKNTRQNSQYQFYSFPTSQHKQLQRDSWISIIRKQNCCDDLNWSPKPTDRLCSEHFIGNKKGEAILSPNYVPTKFSTALLEKDKNESAALQRHKRFIHRTIQQRRLSQPNVVNKKSNKNRKSVKTMERVDSVNENEFNDISVEPMESVKVRDQSCQVDIYLPVSGIEKLFCCNRYIGLESCEAETQTEINMPSLLEVKSQKKFQNKACGTVQKTFIDKGVGSDSVFCDFNDNEICFDGSVKTDEVLTDLAGVSFENFNFLLEKLVVSKQSRIPKKTRLFIFLLKMKTGLTFVAISGMFSIHRTSVSNIFYSTLKTLRTATASLVFWPDKYTVRATMPDCFKPMYCNTRVIIDCTEFKIDVPSKVDDRIFCYSHYKKGFTIKILIGITPTGFICFKSPAAGGRKSDSNLTIESGFIDYLEKGDIVLADKGFPEIKSTIDSKGKKVIVVMPPFLEKKSLFQRRN